MKKSLVILSILSAVVVCVSCRTICKRESSFILKGDENTPFDILLTTNEKDSIFLRTKCKDIKDPEKIGTNKVWQHLFKRMRRTLDEANGVGLAAPQIGVGRNIFLFCRIDKEGHPIEIAVNPRITAHSDDLVCFERDGCLSIPEISGNSLRYSWIEVEYHTEKGEKIKERLNGGTRQTDFTGIIFQHEFDHLQGILFTDRLCP